MVETGGVSQAAVLCGGLAPQTRSQKCCHAGIKIDNDGNIYESNNSGDGWQLLCTWLIVGTNSDFQIVRSIESGTLTTDAGAGPLALGTDREYKNQQCVFGGTATTVITLTLEKVSGSVFVDSREYTLSASLP